MRGDKFTFCYKKMDKNIASKITTEIMKKAKQRSWVARLFDMDDNSVSPSTLFMLILLHLLMDTMVTVAIHSV